MEYTSVIIVDTHALMMGKWYYKPFNYTFTHSHMSLFKMSSLKVTAITGLRDELADSLLLFFIGSAPSRLVYVVIGEILESVRSWAELGYYAFH